MLSDAVSALRCPVCQGIFDLREGAPTTLACRAGHLFDAAKQGYFNFLTGKGTVFEADTADMVAARFRFLDSGHYNGLARALADTAAEALDRPDALVLDAGTGTGHYLRTVIEATGASAVGMDISKFALRRAARINTQAANLVWDIWRPLPMADNSADVVTVVFAPRNPTEFARVLRPGGRLLVVTPRPGHLQEVAARTGMLGIEEGKEERLAESMNAYFPSSASQSLDLPLVLGPSEVADLAYMGPAGHHLHREKLAELSASDGPVATTAKFRISVFTAS
ncbi:methyltransferase domain-containing protein [Paenarthrobacter nitroguajacolicus]|uniref:methyltransferase domain-containing protein n=1 Tax=Paenarthrobacter nitroguajacolicus TaxID=211146 RepID=UPI00248C6D18|nr:methyltransferase domain-containing protein [Paenarthrobacter nitroguajacolicus]MDI2033960.1 23S rRNA (guanine(748)-N(1))-methyltransferase [Paenarthrobacter nitroguajacolicus]